MLKAALFVVDDRYAIARVAERLAGSRIARTAFLQAWIVDRADERRVREGTAREAKPDLNARLSLEPTAVTRPVLTSDGMIDVCERIHELAWRNVGWSDGRRGR